MAKRTQKICNVKFHKYKNMQQKCFGFDNNKSKQLFCAIVAHLMEKYLTEMKWKKERWKEWKKKNEGKRVESSWIECACIGTTFREQFQIQDHNSVAFTRKLCTANR